MKKRYLVPLVFILALGIFVSFAMSAEFWASKGSDKYHYPSCKWAQKIKPDNLVRFSSTEQAAKAGYAPCKVCKPPAAK